MEQEEFISRQIAAGAFRSESDVIREALRVLELLEESTPSPKLEEELRQGLASPKVPWRKDHFASLPERLGRKK
jgi:putative addiction module CopG family antidote